MTFFQNRNVVIFRTFFVISAVTLGGGLAMLPIIQREFTEKHPWITEEDMTDIIALAQSSPGIIAANISVLAGYRMGGIAGAVSALIGVTIPPFLSIAVIASLFQTLSASETLNTIFAGIRSAVCALILAAAIRMSKKILRGKFSTVLAILGFAGILFNMNAILLVILSGGAGIVNMLLQRRKHA